MEPNNKHLNSINSSAIIGAKVSLGLKICVGAYSIIGCVYPDTEDIETIIGNNCDILHHVIVEPGAEIGENVFIDHFSRIGNKSKIGNNTMILYGSRIHDEVIIGTHCRIAGNCPDRTTIGNNVTHMGRINHSYNFPFDDWNKPNEVAATIEDNVVIGANALLIGNIRIGNNTFISPGEIIRKNIPANSFCFNSKVINMPDWPEKIKCLTGL
jgi:acetyltransferase-like isoleucine patch superfamily enzyme